MKKKTAKKANDIDRIIGDLSAVDASFKKDEPALRAIITKMIEEKPRIAVNASFKKRLKDELAAASLKSRKSTSIIRIVFEKRWLLSAAAVVLVIVISAPVIKNMMSSKKGSSFAAAQEEQAATAPSGTAISQRAAGTEVQKKSVADDMKENARSRREDISSSTVKKQENAVVVHEEKKRLRAAEATQEENREKKLAKDDAPVSKEKKTMESDGIGRAEAEKAAAPRMPLTRTATAPAAGAASPARVMENDFAATKGNPYAAFFIEFRNAAAYYGSTPEGSAESTSAVDEIRKIVDAGSLPGKQAVRIEGIINSFSYDYPEDTPFSLTVEYAACPWNSGHTIVHVGIRSSDLGAISRVQIEFNPAFIAAQRILGANRIPAGTRGTTITALYETIPAGVPGTGDAVVTVRAYYLSGGSKMISQQFSGKALTMSDASVNMRFAAAAAEFGLLISDSQFKGNARYENIIDRAAKARNFDAQGERLGFIRLVETAARMQK
ncbi:MAG: von Willebrand factor type A domain-containing protein [Spirochaetes bacterium]|nr:von Willebrand factor type A domain-containing protein [Spirochaetota bacterium]